MEKLSKNRGAISVFLLILFVVTYVAMGMLVDAARYRMSRTYAEAALDMATESILANYDNALFEIYGLFGADIRTEGKTVEEALKEIYTNYLNSLFGTLSIEDDSDTTELANLLADSLFEDNGKHYLTTSQMYRFEIDRLDAGTSITLASTENVESQIIEYMKFRAPVEIVGELAGEGGFLQKLQNLLGFKDRIAAAVEAAKISEEFEQSGAIDEAKKLLEEINAFANRLYDFSSKRGMPYAQLSDKRPDMREKDAYLVGHAYQDFDRGLDYAQETYENSCTDINKEFYENIRTLLKEAQDACTEEIILDRTYKKKGSMLEETNRFKEIDLDKVEGGQVDGQLEELADNVHKKLGTAANETDKTVYAEFDEKYEILYIERDGRLKEAETLRNEEFRTQVNVLVNCFKNWENSAKLLYEEAVRLEKAIIELEEKYKGHIQELESGLARHKDDENYKTVYLPKLELAKANAGEIVKNLDLITGCQECLKEWSEGTYEGDGTALDSLGAVAGFVVQARQDPKKGNLGNYTSLSKRLPDMKNGTLPDGLSSTIYDESAMALSSTVNGYLAEVYDAAFYFQANDYREDIDVKDEIKDNIKNSQEEGKKAAENINNAEEKNGKKKKDVDAELIKKNPEWLTAIENQKKGESKEEDVSEFRFNGSVAAVMQIGLNLFDKIGNFLEGLRDNLYVDAYAMTHFPNYAEHYAKEGSESSELVKKYGDYCASRAEVEYIIAGKSGTYGAGFGYQNVNTVQGKLFCIRMLFNSLAIFTDSAKIQQAMVFASAFGPFALGVMIALLGLWAAAESALDVVKLLEGGSVPVFKQGGDWEFSVGGLYKKGVGILVGAAAGKAEEIAGEYLNTAIDGMAGSLNRMIYEAYTNADGGISLQDMVWEGLGMIDTEAANAQESVLEYGNTLCENIKGLTDDEGQSLVGDVLQAGVSKAFQEYEKGIREIGGTIGKYTEELKDEVSKIEDNILNMRAVSRLANEVKVKARQTLGTLSENLGDKAAEAISQNLSKVIPVGKVQNTGTTDQSMMFSYTDYLWFFLVIMNQETKVQRIQEMVQVNIRYYYATQKEVGNPVEYFALKDIPVAVWADMDYSIGLFFLSNGIVPEQFRIKDKDGNALHRLKNKVISAQSY